MPSIVNHAMPMASVIPELAYADVRAAATWLCTAFGFRERLLIGSHRIQLHAGTGAVIAVHGTPTPATTSISIMVRVDDVDAHCAAARTNGAVIVRETTTYPYGERQYTARDLAGYTWTFSQSVADVDPATWGGTLVENEHAA